MHTNIFLICFILLISLLNSPFPIQEICSMSHQEPTPRFESPDKESMSLTDVYFLQVYL